MLELDQDLQLKEEFILYQLEVGEGKAWLFNIENGDSFKLNETSYDILSMFDGKRSIGEIRKCIADKYQDIDPGEISGDFDELVEEMIRNNIFK